MDFETTIIVGRLGKDPVRTPSGKVSFDVAVGRYWTNSNGDEVKRTRWYTVWVSNGQANACEKYLVKGQEVTVEGTVDASAYTDNEGKAVGKLNLNAKNIRFGGKPNGAAQQEAPEAADNDDCPF